MTDYDTPLSRMERKKIKTQESIIKITIDLVESQGFDETTMEQIAENADIAKGTLYNYYSSKEEIISAYIQGTFATENRGRIEAFKTLKSTEERLTYLFDLLLAGVRRRKILFEKYILFQMRQMVQFEKKSQDQSGIDSPIAAILKMGQAQGEVRTDLSLEMLSEFVLFVFIELVKQFYLDPENFNQDESIRKGVSMFLMGGRSDQY